MEELRIIYMLPKKEKIISLISGIYMSIGTLAIIVLQIIANKYGFVFYAGLAGLLIGVLRILSATVWQKSTTILIDNDEIDITLPNQKINGSITWENVTSVGIGISYITLTSSPTNYKLDLGNLKYNDLKRVKTKLIEICESKNIPFSNI